VIAYLLSRKVISLQFITSFKASVPYFGLVIYGFTGIFSVSSVLLFKDLFSKTLEYKNPQVS